MRLGITLALALCAPLATAEVVDRIAVVVDTQVIKQSDILDEIRVTDFLNNAKLNLGLAAQKEAANRLIDQKVIRKAMETGLYQAPAKAESEGLLEQVRKRFSSDAAYKRELTAYGITDEMLREHVLWQLAVLRFISLRFPASDPKGADPSADGAADATNDQFFGWLDETRKQTRIQFKMADLQPALQLQPELRGDPK